MKKRQPHKNIPEGHFEEEQGQSGFYGPVSHLIKKKPSTRWTHIEGNLKPRLFNLPEIKQEQSWQRLLYNDHLTTYFFQCEKSSSEVFKNANGDLMFFCHKGKGKVLTEYGLLNYYEGQYILIPKSIAYVFIPCSPSQFFVIESFKKPLPRAKQRAFRPPWPLHTRFSCSAQLKRVEFLFKRKPIGI